MSFLNLENDLQQYVEETPVEEGEYELRITQASIPEGKNYLLVRFEIVGQPYAKEVSRFFNLPGAGRNEKEENRNRGLLLKFFNAFDIDPNGHYEVDKQEPEGFVGRSGYAMLSAPVDKNDQYGPQNNISRFCVRG